MEIKNIAVEKLIPYEKNNKEHDETQINRIANSIKEFGFRQPLVVDKNNVIIVWHWRLEWAKKLWLKEVPCIIADDLTEEQIRKYRILDNKLNESEWNLWNLKLELDELWNLDMWDIHLSISDVFPEFDAPEFDPDEYWDEAFNNEKELKLIVYVKDEWELNLLKDDLKNLWYNNFK